MAQPSRSASANTTALEIVSPERLLLQRAVDMVVIPASEGEIGVLPGHAPMIVTLRGGTIRLFENGQVVDRLFVAGGFAEITPDRCTVLADEAEPVAELTRDGAATQFREAQAGYDAADKMDMPALDRALEQLQAAQARLEAVGG